MEKEKIESLATVIVQFFYRQFPKLDFTEEQDVESGIVLTFYGWSKLSKQEKSFVEDTLIFLLDLKYTYNTDKLLVLVK